MQTDKKDIKRHERIVVRQITLVVAGFFLAFLILGAAAKIVLTNQEENYNKLDYLVNQSNAKSIAMTQLSDAIRDRMLIVFDILNSTDAFDIDDLSMELAAKARNFLKAREQLMALDLTQGQIDELVDQRKILKQAQIALGKIVENAVNETGDNQILLINKAREVNAGVLVRLNNMRKDQINIAQKELLAANSSYESTRNQMFILGMFGVVISLIIVFIVIRQIRSQGSILTNVMQQLEESNLTLENRVDKRTKELMHSRAENMRMGAELDVSRQLQKVILPTSEEVSEIESLDIAAFMEPADEIGGDYYEVLKHDDGALFAIGDVTGHGLESGIVMLMIQSIIRAQSNIPGYDLVTMLQIANKTIHDNVSRMKSEKNLTLMLLDYNRTIESESHEKGKAVGQLNYSGQHESLIVVRNNGELEELDTDELGFPIGLVEDADDFFKQQSVELYKGDTVVLYTDGITEAANTNHELYGIDRLCNVIKENYLKSSEEIKNLVINNVKQHIGKQKVFDDLTLLVMKQM